MPVRRASRALQLALLTLAVTAAAFAGNALTPLQESMRQALHLTDNQIGFLQGPALAFPMALAAVPLGIIIDRYSRARLLTILTAVDLLGTGLTALSPNFVTLCIARCLIGFSSFAMNPVAFSAVADFYVPSQRGRANMVMVVGQYVGTAGVFSLGGILLSRSSAGGDAWRFSLAAFCVPLIVALVTLRWLREPPRQEQALKEPTPEAAWGELKRCRRLIAPLFFGVLLAQIGLGANLIWGASMLVRNFSMAAERVGSIMGAGVLLSGVGGSVLGGMLADFGQKSGGPRLTLRILAGLATLCVFTGFFAFGFSAGAASALFTLFITLVTAISVMGLTLLVVVIPNELRGLCMTGVMAACIVVGNGLAPLGVSALATAMGNVTAIGEALSLICIVTSVLGAITFASSVRFFPRSLP